MLRVLVTTNWSVQYDGHSVLELVGEKSKMTFAEIMQVIKNEGGYVDSNAIIHKGTAENKIVTLD